MAKPAETVSSLQPYPAYKPSAVKWLGDVPAHWEVLPLKRVARFSGGTGFPISAQGESGGEILFAKVADMNRLGNENELVSAANSVSREVAHDLGARIFGGNAIVFPKVGGALLTNKRRKLVRRTCIDNNLMACVVTGLDGEFAFCLLKWLDLGSMAKPGPVPAISEGEVREIRISVPPLAEQAAIARYLDDADQRIRRCIDAKERLIKLLEEQRQALVNEVVTGRVDVRTGQPYPAYKSSGVVGLGEVPSHWDVRAAKWHFREVDERSTTGLEELLSVSHLTGVTPRSGKNVTMFKSESNVGYKICKSGDVVINTMWAWMAALGVARQLGLVSPSYAVYRRNCNSLLSGDYGELLLRSAPYQAEYRRLSTGIRPSRLRLYPDAFRRIRMVCPPPSEQSDIVALVQRESANSERAFHLIRQEIAILQEYRTRLIADVVTGKLDVRAAAAQLPDGIEQSEPYTELDAPAKIDPAPANDLGTSAWEPET